MPEDEFHSIFHCTTVQNLWKEIQPHLLKIHPSPVTKQEMAFGIFGKTKNIILRNWLTFLLRQTIAEHERLAYHNKKGLRNEMKIKMDYNEEVKRQVWQQLNILTNINRLDYFRESYAVNQYLIAWEDDQWQILKLFTIN